MSTVLVLKPTLSERVPQAQSRTEAFATKHFALRAAPRPASCMFRWSQRAPSAPLLLCCWTSAFA